MWPRRVGVVLLTAVALVACSPATREVDTAEGGGAGDTAAGLVPGSVRDPVPDVSELEALEFTADPEGVMTSFVPPEGELFAIYFGYLSCPDICPLTMADTAAALNKLDPSDAARITPVFATLDSERDTGQRMIDYMEHFFPDRSFRVYQAPDTRALNKLAYHFHVQYSIPAHESGEFYAVAHSGFLYIVDDQGLVVREFDFGSKSDSIAAGFERELAVQDARES